MQKTAIILFNLGGPDKQESVKPFLFNLFNDKAIISLPQPFRFFLAKLISSRREKKAQAIYAQIGGKSPLLEISNAQAHHLERELSFVGDFKTFVVMRYFHPFAFDVAKKVFEYNPDKIIYLPLYPQFSTSTTASSFLDFDMALKRVYYGLAKPEVKKVCCYFDHFEFIFSHAKLIKQKIIEFNLDFSNSRILFSAHGLPQKLIDQGDPYVFQIEKSTQKIVEKLAEIFAINQEKIDFKVCYQSKVGPLKWTSPSLEHELRRASLDGKNTVIVPIAFVSEHSETLVELDIEYKELAQKIGIKNYVRVQAFNVDGHFINSLKEICLSVTKKDGEIFSSTNIARSCPKKFCKCLK